MLPNLQSALGLVVIIGGCWAISEDRARTPSVRWIAGAVGLQLLIAVVVLKVPWVWALLGAANEGMNAVQAASLAGSSYMFGYLGGADLPFELKPGARPPVVIAFQILPVVMVTSALVSLLWHVGVLRWITYALSWLLRRTLGIGGAVALNAGANVFLGVVEAPIVVRAYLLKMSRSELFAILTLGLANVSGVVFALYSQTIGAVVDNAFAHILAASLLSLPGALLLARLMVPGDDRTEVEPEGELRYESAVDAIITGTMDGLQLFLSILAVLTVTFALVSLTDRGLSLLPEVAGAAITLQRAFGWLFAPLMWLIGVPWAEAATAGSLMGTKAILNEYVAYQQLAAIDPALLSPRSRLLVVYALCGFANLASVGLMISTIGTLAPERRAEVSELGMKAWLAGNLTTAMAAAVVGVLTLSP